MSLTEDEPAIQPNALTKVIGAMASFNCPACLAFPDARHTCGKTGKFTLDLGLTL